jgi:hypothetical protein
MNNNRKISLRCIAEAYGKGDRGTTLTEMMVAITVTVVMMAVAGVVFKNAIDASGTATVTGDMMATARGIIQQLEQDFKGLRADLPMAVIFEIDGDGYRHDRIVFFADGDFQVPYSGAPSGNLARIFYGQTTDNSGGFGWLARRFKIMTADAGGPALVFYPDPSNNGWATSELYDYDLFEGATAADWKNISSLASLPISGFPANFTNYYFNEGWHYVNLDNPMVYDAEVSFIQRPNIDNINNLLPDDAVQRLYMAGYIGEFKIEMVGGDYTNNDAWSSPVELISGVGYLSTGVSWAYYWNVDDMNSTDTLTQITQMPGSTSYTWWCSDEDLVGGVRVVYWPEAIKFTFTLYEKNVKYYPDGQTFSYIVKLNQPK